MARRCRHDIYVHIGGIDIVRVDPETFYVLEDNARTPSGRSPTCWRTGRSCCGCSRNCSRATVFAPVENYPDELLATLKSVAPSTSSADPVVGCSRAGVYNSAYYEHSFLADKLGVELVEGRDLFIKDEVVFMRTTQGPKRVDVIYRRIDDDFLDPLAFRPDFRARGAGPECRPTRPATSRWRMPSAPGFAAMTRRSNSLYAAIVKF